MAQSIKIEVNPSLLRWARTSIGLSVEAAAKKLDIAPAAVMSWENGTASPTLAKLRLAAKAYKRPLAVFFLSDVPRDFQVMHDFRRMSDGAPVASSPELLYEVRKAHSRRGDAIELVKDLEIEPERFVGFSTALEDDTEVIASRLRDFLGVTLSEQLKWRDNSKALLKWRSRIEARGVLVFQASRIPLTEMRGFSISEELFPVIVLNSSDAPAGKIFSLLHELTHLLLRAGGICNFVESARSSDQDANVEFFCNRVAGAAIAPRDALQSDQTTVQLVRDRILASHELLAEIAKRFSTSKEVIARRLLLLKVISQDRYETLRAEFVEEYKRLAAEKESFPVPYHYKILGANGVEFTKMVLSAYHQDKITSSELSDYLSMKLKHLPNVESEVYGRAA
jgi:Zn-dependent peptidase ImmA (M78 family)/DNA-binding XRE family transcriptional regulator